VGLDGADVTPYFGLQGYIAATADELALIELKMGWRNLKIKSVCARVPRSDVASVELAYDLQHGGLARKFVAELKRGGTVVVQGATASGSRELPPQ